MLSKKVRRGLRLTGYCLMFLSIFLVLLNFLAATFYKKAFREKLTSFVAESSGHQYTIRLNEIHLNFLLGRVGLGNVSIESNDSVYLELKSKGLAPKNRYHLTAREIQISFSELHKALTEGLVHISSLRLVNPDIHIRNDSVPGLLRNEVTIQSGKPFTRGFIRKLIIDDFEILHGSVTYVKSGLKNGEIFSCRSTKVDFHAADIYLDRHSFEALSPAAFLDKTDYTLNMLGLSFKKLPGSYAYTAKKIRIAKADNEVRIDGLEMRPQFAVPGFDLGLNQNPGQDFMTLDVDNIRLKIAAFFNMLKTGDIDIPYILVEGADFRYNSDGVPGKKVKVYDMPQDFIRKLKPRLNIDSIDIRGGMVTYQDYNAATHKNGKVEFDQITGMISHLSNSTRSILQHPDLNIAIRTRLYDKGDLQLNFSFNMQSKQDSFRYSGLMGYFPLTSINQITVPLSSLQIVRGNAVRCRFDVLADSRGANGKITGNYHNLYIKLLADDTTRAAFHKMKTLSSLANMFMVLNDNPLINEPVRTEKIQASRDENRSFFRYLWRSVLSGLKPTIGMQKGREENFSSFITRFRHFSDWHRSGRQARLQKRLKRRELRRMHHKHPVKF